MPKNFKPLFVLNCQLPVVQVSVANTNRDGSGTLVDVITGAANDTRIEMIVIKATGTTTGGMVRLFIYDGTNTRLWQEVAVTAATPSATVKTFESELSRSDGRPLIVLPSTWKIRASTHNAETFNVIPVLCGDF